MHWKKSWMQTGHWPVCCAGGEEEEFSESQFPCLPLYIICIQKSDKGEQFRSLTKVHNLLTENQESSIITIWSCYALKESDTFRLTNNYQASCPPDHDPGTLGRQQMLPLHHSHPQHMGKVQHMLWWIHPFQQLCMLATPVTAVHSDTALRTHLAWA